MSASPDVVRERKRAHMARRRAADPESVRRYAREDHARNRTARTAKMRAYYARRYFWGRAMKLRGADRASTRDLASLWKRQRGICALTGRRLDRTAQLDHIVSRAKGGADSIDNLRWVCAAVNYAKRDLGDAEFGALCADVMRWIGARIQESESRPKAANARKKAK